MSVSEYLFDWKNPNISNWKKILRLKLIHGFEDIECRGISPQEVAIEILKKHEKDLKDDELEFVKGLLR